MGQGAGTSSHGVSAPIVARWATISITDWRVPGKTTAASDSFF